MSQDKELEIQLQFLDEAHEYLSTIESAVLGLANRGIDIQRMNAALRAAHSVKGGAAMMGFQELSEFAHRLEDSFKVLKVQKEQLEPNGDLEHLLLKGVDCLYHLVQVYRQRQGVDADWLEITATPLFDQLHEQLGDPQAEDAHSILSPEDGQDILPLLFQTEVEGCLQRIEAVVEGNGPYLLEEIEILAQELAGLGEMLQLSAFTQLCQSVSYALSTCPDQVDTIAQRALEAWRRSQALVLTGNLDALPTMLDGFELPVRSPDIEISRDIDDFSDLALTEAKGAIADLDWDQAVAVPLGNVDITSVQFDDEPQDEDTLIHVLGEPELLEASPPPTSSESETDYPTEEIELSVLVDVESVVERLSLNEGDVDGVTEMLDAELLPATPSGYQELPPPTIGATTGAKSGKKATSVRVPLSGGSTVGGANFQDAEEEVSSDNTVRVPVKQLDQLNDLFGELTIERNRLEMEVKRLRGLLQKLGDRVQSLDQSNIAIRNTYDRVTLATNSDLRPLLPSALPPARNGDGDAGWLAQPSLPMATDEAIAHLNAFDSLEMDRYGNLHLVFQEIMETIVQIQEVTSDLDLGLEDTEQTARDLNKTAKQLRNNLTQLRMRPLSDVTDRFPRALRELSLKYNKPVQLSLQGAHTLVDRNVLEALNDPIMHIIRNAFDHGIEAVEQRRTAGKPEEGLIEITAIHQSNYTVISIRDDGRGIPIEKIRTRAREMGLDESLLAAASDEELLSLIFEPGFSTADQVTDLSGRGVGMDVVRNNLRQVRGEIAVSTEAGVGTTFTITVPLALSVARVLIVESNRMLLAFPSDVIEEMILLTPDQIVRTAGSEAFDWDGMMVQLVRLSDWLRFNCPRQLEGLDTNPTIAVPSVLLLRQANQLIGLQVDRCWGEQEVAIRRVAGGLPLPTGFGNCTILGDGSVVPLISVSELLYWIASCERADQGVASPQPTLPRIRSFIGTEETSRPLEDKTTVLIVDDSINVRRLLALTLEKAGYQVAQAKDGQDAVEKLLAGLQPNAVICDIEMPRMDGYGFLARIRSLNDFKRLPIAMLTSRSGDKHRKLALSLGANAYFSKPYNEQMLLQTLNDLISLTPA